VDQIAGPDERIADDTLSVALFAEPPDGNTGLLSAHNQVRMMLGHLESIIIQFRLVPFFPINVGSPSLSRHSNGGFLTHPTKNPIFTAYRTF